MNTTQELLHFIHEASKATYASGDDSLFKKEDDGSTSISFSQGDYSFHDNFFGGEPYGGREVVFQKGQPIWMMVYYGWVEPSVSEPGSIYSVLQEALRNAPPEMPFRGPKEYIKENRRYSFTITGDVRRFAGQEVITEDGVEIYRANFNGGFVDQR